MAQRHKNNHLVHHYYNGDLTRPKTLVNTSPHIWRIRVLTILRKNGIKKISQLSEKKQIQVNRIFFTIKEECQKHNNADFYCKICGTKYVINDEVSWMRKGKNQLLGCCDTCEYEKNPSI